MGFADELNSLASNDELEGVRLQLAQTKKQKAAAEELNLRLSTRVQELERALSIVDEATNASINPPKWLSQPPSSRKKHATLALMLSDTHFDEVVDPIEINNLNAYNREIAEARLKEWVSNSIKMARHYLSGLTYDGVVVMLGGDIFSGDIHDELKESNEAPILDSLLHWSEQISAALHVLGDEFGKVHVPCVVGNHGRLSRKPRMKQRARTNLDWMLGKMVERHFVNDKRFTFQISDNADVVTDIYQWKHLLSHGDQVSGGGGIGGIWPPIMRMRARKAQRAHDIGDTFQTMWIGHWHQYIATPSMVVNGSLKGLDEYAWINNFGFEVPQQALAVITPEHNITFQAPVFCQNERQKNGAYPLCDLA